MKFTVSTFNRLSASVSASALHGCAVQGVGGQLGFQALAKSAQVATPWMPVSRISGTAGLNYFDVPPWGDVS